MKRREFLKGGVALTIASTGFVFSHRPAYSKAVMEKINDFPGFPYDLFQVKGSDLPGIWRKLQKEENSTPVILGEITNIKRIADNVTSLGEGNARSTKIKMTITAASYLKHPESVLKLQENETYDSKEKYHKKIAHLEKKVESNNKKLLDIFKLSMNESLGPETGKWPEKMPGETKFSFSNIVPPTAPAYVAVIPTKDQSHIPAYLGFGGWGNCPTDEYHISALRSWEKRYNAELISLGSDSMRLKVSKRPADKKEAMALAREQYAYCKNITKGGKWTISDIAARLMRSDEWHFWWE